MPQSYVLGISVLWLSFARGGPMAWSFHELPQAVREGNSCRPDFAQAWKVERILEAARRSQQTRAWLDLADVV